MKRFPRWFAFSHSLRTVTVQEWIDHGMTLFRFEWYGQVEMAHQVHEQNQQMLHLVTENAPKKFKKRRPQFQNC